MNKLIYRTRVFAEADDYESVKALTVECACGTAIPDETVERLICEREFPLICRTCGRISRLTLTELDEYADSLTVSIEALCVGESRQKGLTLPSVERLVMHVDWVSLNALACA